MVHMGTTNLPKTQNLFVQHKSETLRTLNYKHRYPSSPNISLLKIVTSICDQFKPGTTKIPTS